MLFSYGKCLVINTCWLMIFFYFVSWQIKLFFFFQERKHVLSVYLFNVFLSFIHISLLWQFSWFLEHFKRCSLTLKNHNSRCDSRKIISNISKFKLAFPLPNELQMIIRRLFFIYEAIKRSNTFFWDTQLFWIVF